MGRFSMFYNAMECTVDWIDQSVKRASASGKKALFFVIHAAFYDAYGTGPNGHPDGTFYAKDNFLGFMKNTTGRTDVQVVYGPLFNKLTQMAFAYRDLQITVVHADGHRFQTMRLNPGLQNTATSGSGYRTNHNLKTHMVEGDSKSLTMWTRILVDIAASFQPVTIKEDWSLTAFNTIPKGHSWIL
jgi:hypothetical protein